MWALRNVLRTHYRQISTVARGHGAEKSMTIPPSLLLSPSLNLAARSSVNLDLGVSTNKIPSVENPLQSWKIIDTPKTNLNNEINDIMNRITDLSLPTDVRNQVGDGGIQAVRMIVIRRKKMKKHKRRKLYKRMKFEWAKRRQRRLLRREKEFKAGLVNQIKEAEKFSAEEYVTAKLNKLNDNPLPRLWKGKRLPQFIIKQLAEEEKIKKAKFAARKERIEKYKNWKL